MADGETTDNGVGETYTPPDFESLAASIELTGSDLAAIFAMAVHNRQLALQYWSSAKTNNRQVASAYRINAGNFDKVADHLTGVLSIIVPDNDWDGADWRGLSIQAAKQTIEQEVAEVS